MTSWLQADGTPIACVEKLKVLAENDRELHEVMRDAFDDAVLMGVDPAQMRRRLTAMVEALQGPKRA